MSEREPTRDEDAGVVSEGLRLMFDIDEEEREAGIAALDRLEARLASAEKERDEAIAALREVQEQPGLSNGGLHGCYAVTLRFFAAAPPVGEGSASPIEEKDAKDAKS